MNNGNGNGNGHAAVPPDPNQQRWSAIPQSLVDPSGVHNAEPIWPGVNGIPFHGAAPNLKQNDPVQPQEGGICKVEQLDLSKPEDLEHYSHIGQLRINGMAEISFDERIYDEETKSWRVLIRWVQMYTYMPKHGRHQYGNGIG
jgi:hypothetical protein